MVEIDLKAVRKVGTEHFPDLADTYGVIAAILENVMSEKSPRGMYTANYADAWVEYANIVHLALTTSQKHLDDCGETLVELVDEYDLTDSAAADQVRHASESTLDIQLGLPD